MFPVCPAAMCLPNINIKIYLGLCPNSKCGKKIMYTLTIIHNGSCIKSIHYFEIAKWLLNSKNVSHKLGYAFF